MLDAQLVAPEEKQRKYSAQTNNWAKLKSSEALSLKSPVSLLRNVWFHIVLFFCRRSWEGQRQLTRSSFKLKVDHSATRRNVMTMAHDEISKNNPGDLKDANSTEK
jgi:hypothetical protein